MKISEKAYKFISVLAIIGVMLLAWQVPILRFISEIFVSPARALSTSQFPGTTSGAGDTGIGCSDNMTWDGTGSPGNASSSDNSYIAEDGAALDNGNVSDELRFSNFGFSIPDGSSIDGVVVELERFSAESVTDYHVYITTTAGVQEGTDHSAGATWETSDLDSFAVSFGNSTDDWGATGGLTEAEVEGSGFGVVICARAGTDNAHPKIDALRITVHYTEPVPADLTWVTGSADFEIYQSSSLTWDAGTSICSGTLTDTNGDTVSCSSGAVAHSTTYRVQVVLKNSGGTTAAMQGASEYVDFKNVQGGWAGTSPTISSTSDCGFNDTGDDSSPVCYVTFNGNDVRMIALTGIAGTVNIAASGTEGFMFLITTGDDVPSSNSTSYWDSSIDSITEDSSMITISGPSGTLSLTASSSQSFNTSITYQFTSQTATASSIGAVQISDNRGGAPGWALDLATVDWAQEKYGGPGEHHNQLDYDGTGSDNSLGKLCAFPASANLYAQSGSLTGVSTGDNECFSASNPSVDLVTATSGNGTGIYWLTDLALEQYYPGSPTVQVYTTTLTLTLTFNDHTPPHPNSS